jgi:hypothetical protein
MFKTECGLSSLLMSLAFAQRQKWLDQNSKKKYKVANHQHGDKKVITWDMDGGSCNKEEKCV